MYPPTHPLQTLSLIPGKCFDSGEIYTEKFFSFYQTTEKIFSCYQTRVLIKTSYAAYEYHPLIVLNLCDKAGVKFI